MKNYHPGIDAAFIVSLIRLAIISFLIAGFVSCTANRYGRKCEGAAKFIGTGHSTKSVLRNNRN